VIAFQTSTRIGRPVEQVFSYVADPLNLPRWNSAVQDVHETSPGDTGVASTYVMVRELPTGRAVNKLEIVAIEPPSEFVIRASEGPTPFLYRYRFSSEKGETFMHLSAEVELARPAGLLPQLARSAVRKGVDANFAALKALLEGQASRASMSPGGTAPSRRSRHSASRS
jgi:uncharacterized protein YndB with AHSA1/START domain